MKKKLDTGGKARRATVLAVAAPKEGYVNKDPVLENMLLQAEEDLWRSAIEQENRSYTDPLANTPFDTRMQAVEQFNQLQDQTFQQTRDKTFMDEFNRTKKGFETFYPGGVNVAPVYGPDEVLEALSSLGQDDDLIIMDHIGTQIAGLPIFQGEGTEDVPWEAILRGKRDQGYRGRCILGSCHSGEEARKLNRLTGVPVLARPEGLPYFGPNMRNLSGSFEDFFFGIENPDTLLNKATEGRDYVYYNQTAP